MVTINNDKVIMRSVRFTDVTINATTYYTYNEQTSGYDIIALVSAIVGSLRGDIEIYPYSNVKTETIAKELCDQFVKDVRDMSRNQPEKYGAFLGAVENIAVSLPKDRSEMKGLFVKLAIPLKYRTEDNPFLYRN